MCQFDTQDCAGSLLWQVGAGLEEAQAGIKIAGRNTNNLRYTQPLWQKAKRN